MPAYINPHMRNMIIPSRIGNSTMPIFVAMNMQMRMKMIGNTSSVVSAPVVVLVANRKFVCPVAVLCWTKTFEPLIFIVNCETEKRKESVSVPRLLIPRTRLGAESER